MSAIPLTVRGAERLQEELQRLKTVERPAVINAIAEARAQGDLSENAEYDAARERQGFIEGRIAELEGTLSNAHLIDPSSLEAEGRAVFGATVDIEDLDSGDRVTYQIVGDVEADLKANLILSLIHISVIRTRRSSLYRSAGVQRIRACGGARSRTGAPMLEKLKVRTGMMLVLACFVITLALACGLSWMNAESSVREIEDLNNVAVHQVDPLYESNAALLRVRLSLGSGIADLQAGAQDQAASAEAAAAAPVSYTHLGERRWHGRIHGTRCSCVPLRA